MKNFIPTELDLDIALYDSSASQLECLASRLGTPSRPRCLVERLESIPPIEGVLKINSANTESGGFFSLLMAFLSLHVSPRIFSSEENDLFTIRGDHPLFAEIVLARLDNRPCQFHVVCGTRLTIRGKSQFSFRESDFPHNLPKELAPTPFCFVRGNESWISRIDSFHAIRRIDFVRFTEVDTPMRAILKPLEQFLSRNLSLVSHETPSLPEITF